MAQQSADDEIIAPFFKSAFEAVRRLCGLQACKTIEHDDLEQKVEVLSCRTEDIRETFALPGTPLASLRSLAQYGSAEVDNDDEGTGAGLVHLSLLRKLCVPLLSVAILTRR